MEGSAFGAGAMIVRQHQLGWLLAACLTSACTSIDWGSYQVAPPTEDGGGGTGGTPAPPVCGNGVVEDGEACDDGNTDSGDGCAADCARVELCGNGDLDPGEVCDDGNTDPGDGCRADCLGTEQCGDGLLDSHLEEPTSAVIEFLASNIGVGDPAPSLAFTINGTALTSPPVRTGAVCDFGGGGTVMQFGDLTDVGVQSFDVPPDVVAGLLPSGNTIAVDTGDSNAVVLSWAMLTLTSANYEHHVVIADYPPLGEPIDRPGNFCGGFTLDRVNTSLSFDLDLGETCDDANTVSLDGCRDDCVIERCGDGVVQDALGETCDDGNRLGFDTCPSDCKDLRLDVAPATVVSFRNGTDIVANIVYDASDGWPNGFDVQFLDDADQPVGNSLFFVPQDAREFTDFLPISIELTDELTTTPALLSATKVQLIFTDVVSRTGPPTIVDVQTETCGNNTIEGTEECDDGNTDPLDACSTTCRDAAFTLRRVIATRVDNDDLVLITEGLVSEPGISRLDVRFLSNDGSELSSQQVMFDEDPSPTVGAFLKRSTVEGFFVNPVVDSAASVAVTLRDGLGQGSNEFEARLLTSSCGDGVQVQLFEECDDGNTDPSDGCDEHCRKEDPNACNAADYLFCSVPARRRRDTGWLWLAIGALLVMRRSRRA